jgi:hypothetical protein
MSVVVGMSVDPVGTPYTPVPLYGLVLAVEEARTSSACS